MTPKQMSLDSDLFRSIYGVMQLFVCAIIVENDLIGNHGD